MTKSGLIRIRDYGIGWFGDEIKKLGLNLMTQSILIPAKYTVIMEDQTV